MHDMDKSLVELHGMLKNAEPSIKKTVPVLMVRKDKGKSGKDEGKSNAKPKERVGPQTKGKATKTPKSKPLKDGSCFHCKGAGH